MDQGGGKRRSAIIGLYAPIPRRTGAAGSGEASLLRIIGGSASRVARRGMRHDGSAAVKREVNDCPRYATDEKAERDDDGSLLRLALASAAPIFLGLAGHRFAPAPAAWRYSPPVSAHES